MQGTSLRRSLALSFAERYGSLAINVAAVVILARLLTPAQIGVYSVAAAFVALAQVLREFGIGNYLIQEKELTEDRIRTAFGVAIAVAWTIAVLLFLMSAPVAAFYGEPGMKRVLRLLCVTFVVLPFATPVLALLRRDMAFGALLRINLAATAAQAATGVTLASLGHGYMSLAWAALAGAVTTTLAASLHRPALGPTLPSLKEWRRVSAFGGYASGADIVSQIGMAAPDLIIGRLLGFTAVGLFSRAMGLIQMFNQTVMHAVMPVMAPVFAARHREGEELLEPYLRGLSYVTVLAWPFFLFLGLMAQPIIRVLFGDQWDGAVPIVQILCLAGIFRPLFYFAQPVFFALGEVKTSLKVSVVCNTLAVLLFLFGSLHSLKAAAYSPGIFCLAYFWMSFLYLRPLIGLSAQHVLRSIFRSAVVTGLITAPLLLMQFTFLGATAAMWQRLSIGFIVASVSWIIAVFAIRHPFHHEILLLLRYLHPRRGRSLSALARTEKPPVG